MKRLFHFVAMFMAYCMVSGQAGSPQVIIEARFMEVNKNFMQELGVNFGASIDFAHMTNSPTENRVPKTGFNVGAGVEAEPLNGLHTGIGISIFQDGEKYKIDDVLNSLTRNNIEINLLVNPRIIIADSPIELGLVVQPAVAYTLNQVSRYESGGDKNKEKVEFEDNDRRVGASVKTGVSATLRTDIGDLSINGLCRFGLTNINKELDPPQKPLLFEIALIGKLFFKKDNAAKRDNLLIFLSPKIIKSEGE